MRSYSAAFFVAAVVALVMTPLMARFARRVGAVSVSGGRNVHTEETPRLGGLAIALAATIPLLLLIGTKAEVARFVRQEGLLASGLGAGALFLCLVGAFDDARGLGATTKLGAQVLAATLAYAVGFRIEAVNLPFVGDLSMGVFALPVTILWIVGVTNAVNLIDGLDGLAAGVVFFAAGTNFMIALMNGTVLVAIVMASLMGALFGFLFFNFNPARIFMGDSGSYFLGYVLSTVSLAGAQKASTAVSLLVPILALGLPIFDTLFSIARRWFEKKSIFAPDRGHIHHRLLDLGLTHRWAVLTLYSISLLFALLAIGVALGKSWQIGIALAVATIVVFGLLRFAGSFEEMKNRRRQRGGRYDEVTEKLRSHLPPVLVLLESLETIEDVKNRLDELRVRLDFQDLRLESLSGPNSVPSARATTRAAFSLANGEARLKAGWEGDGIVSMEANILLQLLADAVGRALVRSSSSRLAREGVRSAIRLEASTPIALPDQLRDGSLATNESSEEGAS